MLEMVDGLKLFNDGNNGIFIKDGGNIGILLHNPQKKVEIEGAGETLFWWKQLVLVHQA